MWVTADDEHCLAPVSFGQVSLASSLLLSCFEQIVPNLFSCLANDELWPLLAIKSPNKKKKYGALWPPLATLHPSLGMHGESLEYGWQT